MNAEKKTQLRLGIFIGAAVLAGVCLLPLTLPVVLGIGLAFLLNPAIVGLQKKTGFGRGIAAGLTVTGTLVLVGGILFLLGRVLIHEAAAVSSALPGMMETLSGYGRRLAALLSELGSRLPDGAGDAISAWGQELISGSGTLAQKLYEGIFSAVSRFLGALPDSIFFLMTLILAAYFAAGELPRLKELGKLKLPEPVTRWMQTVGCSIRTALGGWFRAQVKLMAVTFLLLTLGLMLLRVDSPLLLALLISLLDALPVFGTGTVLIPWAVVAILSGNMGLGVGLLGLYGAAALTRNVLEPKVLGATLGLSPLLTLVAIYAGWRLFGILGMILLPMGAMVLFQLLGSTKVQHGGATTYDIHRASREMGREL